MYSLSLHREFIAQHYLIGGDWGAENELHSHNFRLELRITSDHLDKHGYIVDLVDLEKQLDDVIDDFQDHTLNELSAFEGLNPSIEHFSRIICQRLVQQNQDKPLTALEVRLWENAEAWASYRQAFE